MLLADNRLELDARPTAVANTVLETVMLGHCPSTTAGLPTADGIFTDGLPHTVKEAQALLGNIRWDRIVADAALLAEITQLGFAKQTSRLRELLAHREANTPVIFTADDEALLELYALPIPLYSLGQFQDIFPDAFTHATQYASVLAGNRAWLPLAVQDYFEHSSSGKNLKLWILRIPELSLVDNNIRHAAQAFLPHPTADMLDIDTLGAFERALLIPRAAILALPDFERLQIPAQLEDIPRLHVKKTEPAFLPCSASVDTDQDDQLIDKAIPQAYEPIATRAVIVPIARTLAQLRPDMQCLLSVSLAAVSGSEQPGASAAFLDCVSNAAALEEDGSLSPQSRGVLTDAIRHLQLLYPYLRGPDRKLSTPAGLVAGQQALVSQSLGPWRSIAGRPLPSRSLPWPSLQPHQATALRNRPGITVLVHRAGQTSVDDERISVPCLPALTLQHLSLKQRNAEHWRSAEIMRFMGWLRRELQALGERMIFVTDARDARPELALRAFFTRLHSLGALRGRRVEDGFTLTRRIAAANVISFDIVIAPAFPIDRLRITFMQDRDSSDASPRIEVNHG